MKKTVESKVAETVLERTTDITIGGETYPVAPPTIATLIEVSELISRMPAVQMNENDILTETLVIAKDCRPMGDILAKLILGHGTHIKTTTTRKTKFWGLITVTTETTIDKQTQLAKRILETTSPKELHAKVVELLKRLEISDFFGLTTSLIEINLIRRTRAREVVNQATETTASGH